MWLLQKLVFQYGHRSTSRRLCKCLWVYFLPSQITWNDNHQSHAFFKGTYYHKKYLVVPQNCQIDIDQQYADEISKISISVSVIEKMKDDISIKITQQWLEIIKTKTREYTINSTNSYNCWGDCKLLGSLLDTQNGTKKRKVLAISAANKLKHCGVV